MEAILKDSPQPFYEQIKEMLREKITRGEYRADSAIPNERALAKQLSLSRMTVRRAIVELTQEGLLTRIRGKGTFVRGSFAPRERRGRPPVVGIVAEFDRTNNQNVFCYRMLAGIQQASEEAGLTLAFRRVSRPHEAFVAGLREDQALKGLVLLEMNNPPLQRLLAKLPIPSVLVDSCQPDENQPLFNEVNHDSQAAVKAAVSSLLRLGHRDVVLMMGESKTFLHLQRREAYEAALREHGLPVREDRIFAFNPSGETAYALMKRLLNEPSPPTALLCAGGDELVHGAMAAVYTHGWRIPRDFSLVAYGDTIGFTVPPLCNIRVPWEQLGIAGIEVLKERFRQPTLPLKRVFLPCEYLQRGSCDTPRAAAPPAGVAVS
ncbi:MAG: GntR family transcriptional regulator [Planctomycetota bacterium]|nr:GntR family transcriptional regulator [Planctomycetota bacterium]